MRGKLNNISRLGIRTLDILRIIFVFYFSKLSLSCTIGSNGNDET
jgi:hypothetical protein